MRGDETKTRRNDSATAERRRQQLAVAVAVNLLVASAAAVSLAGDDAVDGVGTALVIAAEAGAPPVALEGATIDASARIFVVGEGIDEVRFHVDDPDRSADPHSVDATAPFEFVPVGLAAGPHVLTTSVHEDGRWYHRTSSFRVTGVATAPADAPATDLEASGTGAEEPASGTDEVAAGTVPDAPAAPDVRGDEAVNPSSTAPTTAAPGGAAPATTAPPQTSTTAPPPATTTTTAPPATTTTAPPSSPTSVAVPAPGTQGTFTVVHAEPQLHDALATGGNVRLGADIALTRSAQLSSPGQVLDLDGRQLSAADELDSNGMVMLEGEGTEVRRGRLTYVGERSGRLPPAGVWQTGANSTISQVLITGTRHGVGSWASAVGATIERVVTQGIGYVDPEPNRFGTSGYGIYVQSAGANASRTLERFATVGSAGWGLHAYQVSPGELQGLDLDGVAVVGSGNESIVGGARGRGVHIGASGNATHSIEIDGLYVGGDGGNPSEGYRVQFGWSNAGGKAGHPVIVDGLHAFGGIRLEGQWPAGTFVLSNHDDVRPGEGAWIQLHPGLGVAHGGAPVPAGWRPIPGVQQDPGAVVAEPVNDPTFDWL